MRLLLDTHIAVWAALERRRLTQAERALMASADAPLFVSAVTVWELRLKWRSLYASGERKGPIEPASVLVFGAAMGWEFLPLSARHAAATLRRPLSHKDPFDELLLVQAQEEDMRLLTRDGRLASHPFAATGHGTA